MRPVPSTFLVLTLSLTTLGCAEEVLRPVRATMDDGQVLMGEIATPELLLEGGLGVLAIPWDDVGEVIPVEGDELGSSGGYVDVWLRNGSELTGRWVDAELTMDLRVGGDRLAVDVPVSDLLRLQTQGGEVWPEGVVFRVRSSHGDDFLVDPEASRLVLENDMGTFAPFLSECISAAPIDDPTGDWRIELASGTVLIGPLVEDAVTFQLAMGPSVATVPLDKLVSLDRQDWGDHLYRDETTRISDRILSAIPRSAVRQLQPPSAAPAEAYEPIMADEWAAEDTEQVAGIGYVATPPGEQPVDGRFGDTGGQGATEGWFSNNRLRDVKQAMN
jgi:hypothetical protein